MPVLLFQGVSAQEAHDKSVVAKVGDIVITQDDIATVIKERVKSAIVAQTNPILRVAAVKDLIVEAAAKQAITEKELSRNPELARRLDILRSQNLLNYFIDKNVRVSPPTKLQIDQFIQSHPEFFQGRMMYNFADIVVDPKSDTVRKAVRDRVNSLGELKVLDAGMVDRFVQWLSENNIDFGMVRNWTGTDKLKWPLSKTVPEAVRRGAKVLAEEPADKMRIILILGAYPDPLDPIMGRNNAVTWLQDEAKGPQVDAAIKKLLAKADITVYDPSLKGLDVPNAKAGQYVEQIPWRQRLFTIWNFALFLLAPAALYVFSRPDAPAEESFNPSSVFDRLLNHVVFRAVSSLALAVFIGSIMYEVLDAAYVAQDMKDFLANGALGLTVAVGVLALCVFATPLRNLLVSLRWLPASLIVGVQLATALLISN